MADAANEFVLQVPMAREYFERIRVDAVRDDRTNARQAAFLIKSFYDGRLVWAFPGMSTGTAEGGVA